MPEKPLTICNTSPLLYLNLVGQLGLLPRIYQSVAIPPAVQTELQAGGERGVQVPIVEALPWLQVMPLSSGSLIPLVTDLGRGEAEVIGLGLEHPDSRLILDDALARRIARLNGLKFTGTVGVIVKAKQLGFLGAVKPVILDLRQAGLWLNDDLVAEILRQAGES